MHIGNQYVLGAPQKYPSSACCNFLRLFLFPFWLPFLPDRSTILLSSLVVAPSKIFEGFPNKLVLSDDSLTGLRLLPLLSKVFVDFMGFVS